MGNQAPALLRPLGVRLPVYPLKGYSITAPITDGGQAPGMAVMDEHNKIMISRLGNRIRAKLAGLPLQTVRGFGFRLDS